MTYSEEIWMTPLVFSQPADQYLLLRGPLRTWNFTKQRALGEVLGKKIKFRIPGAEIGASGISGLLNQPLIKLDPTKDLIPSRSTMAHPHTFPSELNCLLLILKCHTSFLLPSWTLNGPCHCQLLLYDIPLKQQALAQPLSLDVYSLLRLPFIKLEKWFSEGGGYSFQEAFDSIQWHFSLSNWVRATVT